MTITRAPRPRAPHGLAVLALALLACRAPEPSTGGPTAPQEPAVATPAAGGEAAHGDAAANGDAAAASADGAASATASADVASDDHEAPPDLLTFAQGAIPVRVTGHPGKGAAGWSEALQAIDGSPAAYSMARQAPADAVTEFIYELPAATTLTRLEIPVFGEVPSKFTTFSRALEVHGSSQSADDGYTLLASATLAVSASKDGVTELPLQAKAPIRWLKLRLTGGVLIEAPETTLQFNEIIGHGDQEAPPLLEKFGGAWRTRGANFDLKQEGALVTGCFDDVGELDGSVTGNILRARGVAAGTGVVSLFVLTVMPDGELRGVRSTNGAPFRLITSKAAPADSPTKCPRLRPPALGCGAVIHGLQFAFDSAELRPGAAPILDRLHAGLAAGEGAVIIEGHTSSEGKESYNRDLSRRRAESVVAELVRRGIPRSRLRADGRGPDAPIASNDDEAGRSLNRRVEIRCP